MIAVIVTVSHLALAAIAIVLARRVLRLQAQRADEHDAVIQQTLQLGEVRAQLDEAKAALDDEMADNDRLQLEVDRLAAENTVIRRENDALRADLSRQLTNALEMDT